MLALKRLVSDPGLMVTAPLLRALANAAVEKVRQELARGHDLRRLLMRQVRGRAAQTGPALIEGGPLHVIAVDEVREGGALPGQAVSGILSVAVAVVIDLLLVDVPEEAQEYCCLASTSQDSLLCLLAPGNVEAAQLPRKVHGQATQTCSGFRKSMRHWR